MRSVMVIALGLASLLATPQKADAMFIDRQSRVLFNVALPPNCMPGWYGRGIGIVAICSLGWRRHVRFIDGYVLPCAYPDCRDHAPRIEHFLRYNGF